MKRIALLLLAAIFFSLTSGCQSTGGTVAGLFPAPKMLKGKVSNDTYIAPGEVFSVQLPYPSASSEWTYAQVEEMQEGPMTVVVIGPGAFDLNHYHAALLNMPIPGDRDAYVDKLFSRKVGDRPGIYKQIASQRFMTHGNQTAYEVYESDNAFLVLSLTDMGSRFYLIETDISKNSAKGKTNSEELMNRKWSIFNEMLASFKVK